MQNREELQQKEHNRSQKQIAVRGGKSYSEGGGGVNIVFETNYRPLIHLLILPNSKVDCAAISYVI
jgi:hypothetical protein